MPVSGADAFNFDGLFTLEMANNHQGSVEHGKRIIREAAAAAKEHGVRAAVKLQLRDLDSFIHPAYRERKDVKHIPRFLSTRLSKADFRALVDETRARGLYTMATPFDEPSVDFLQELGVEIVKVASCSATDWPLLEKIAGTGKPIIVSVGGLSIKEVDKVVSFFEHRGVLFALMHCVAIYPTPADKLSLDFIETLKGRYPHLTVGFSTHELPGDTMTIGMAYAKGARIFEKHIGVPTETIQLNAYSANPTELRAWLVAYKTAVASCWGNGRPVSEIERADLQSLRRCVFAKVPIKKGEVISREQVFFAMPLVSPEHLTSGEFRADACADRDYGEGEPLSHTLARRGFSKKETIYEAVREAKAMLNAGKIPLSHDFTVEISHHYGLERFKETGCIIIDCINREYARKLIVQFPGQAHPMHYHKVKDESFHVLSGTVEMDVEGKKKLLTAGDTLWMPRGVWHGFRTDNGVVFEEISTTSLETQGDSYYIDKRISAMPRDARKTKLLNWGRHQFDHLVE
jgi:N-acetylneuraminate synthase